MARFDAILSLTATAAVDGWTTAIMPVLDQLGYLTAGTDRGASLKALRSGDHQRPALKLLLMLTQHVGMMAIECRSDRDGPLARSGR